MEGPVFYMAGSTEGCQEARRVLVSQGIVFAPAPCPEVTDLLMDIPSFLSPGILRNGESAEALLSGFRDSLRIWGGKLSALRIHYRTEDLLQDPGYLAENAAITADCALRLAGQGLKAAWKDTRVLVIGWGRIGKSLCRALRGLGAQVTVCARKAQDRALLSAFGYDTAEPGSLSGDAYDVIFNTAPAPMMTAEETAACPLAMDLASVTGLAGSHVLRARGLPGIYAPVSSGRLIAGTILKKLREVH